MNQGKSALNTLTSPCPARAQTLIRSLLDATTHCSHKLAPFSAFFHQINICPAFALILHHNTASAHAFCSFLSLLLHTVGPLFSPTAVVRTCTPALQSHPIAEPLVPRRASSLPLAIAHRCTLSVFVTHLVQQHSVWLRLIG